MVKKEIREQLAEMNPDLVVFDNPAFDNSIIGVTEDGEQVVYDYHKMIKELAEEDGITEEGAEDFICYNTIRALYYKGHKAPVVICTDCFLH